MTMTRLKISKTLLAVMLTSAVATGSAYAENNAQTTNESAGQKVDSSMNKVGNFMDDSAITSLDDLVRAKNDLTAGDIVRLTIYRSGNYYYVDVTLMDQISPEIY